MVQWVNGANTANKAYAVIYNWEGSLVRRVRVGDDYDHRSLTEIKKVKITDR